MDLVHNQRNRILYEPHGVYTESARHCVHHYWDQDHEIYIAPEYEIDVLGPTLDLRRRLGGQDDQSENLAEREIEFRKKIERILGDLSRTVMEFADSNAVGVADLAALSRDIELQAVALGIGSYAEFAAPGHNWNQFHSEYLRIATPPTRDEEGRPIAPFGGQLKHSPVRESLNFEILDD